MKIEKAAEMEDDMLQNVLSLVPRCFHKLESSLDLLKTEVREEYCVGVTKAIVNFVLRGLKESDSDRESQMPSHRQEIALLPKPWHKTFSTTEPG
ncbi:hypothetical protein WMY93_002206 [Mugilogobius chulae]|uniref:Uncharacterized protein n=1 Tax=Mugilogobius chulae TaxID=88201 RepID=A0AAW0PV57_9GOBI